MHEHDDARSDQEELYAVTGPAVSRAAVATEDGTLLLAVGAPAASGFETTWRPEHFGQVPRAE